MHQQCIIEHSRCLLLSAAEIQNCSHDRFLCVYHGRWRTMV